jgi:hypothetical protein
MKFSPYRQREGDRLDGGGYGGGGGGCSSYIHTGIGSKTSLMNVTLIIAALVVLNITSALVVVDDN